MNFSEIGLGPEVLRAVEDAGYTQPTPIQEQAIPWVLQGRDVLGCAQTGTGKTASFTLPMIEILANGRAKARMPRSLILEPTRELAAQVAENFETYGKHHKLNMALLIGGESFGDQIKKLDRGVDVLIATPGRMIDLFERGNILLSDIKIFVIDEADRMLDMGFIPDIERIVALLPKMRQTLFFSATMPPEIKRLADNFLMNPREVSVSPPASMAETVTHALTVVQPEDKRRALRHLLSTEDVKNALIFCNRKRDVAILHKSLEKHGFNAGALHGDMPQSKRTETLEAFKKGEITLLVCSDVAARGIDIAGLSHVFNFDTPLHAEDYVHRIGRTGRAGRQGRAFTIANPEEGKQVAAISKLIKREIPLISIDGVDLAEFEEISDRRRRRPARKDEARKEEARKEEETKAARPPKSDSRPRPEPRPEREARPDREQRAESMRSDAPRRDRDDRRRRREEDDDDEVVIGFGDHIPAFLLRRARPVATPEA
ncbi:DEAD/DEAH box helicase [Skermanella sp. TT6]|uniref:DEAD/DEAH box helicase n=1 Tax=Skermanella cutis TaxID=2775420 RepID=A0ABX7BAJ9_9PROT|nr:DEAD/DEAH box helicase [Skermanella sp. TT6]QQP91417.1 DEAD/DEAH box helicase [Skermanella sp. TT6]